MITFVLIVLAMALATVALVTRPLWWPKKPTAAVDDTAHANQPASRPLPQPAL